MARSLPPLNPLYVFDVASRAGSFTKAAEILGVTPSAVSRQIAVLENFLDLRLFHRGYDGNTLTEAGEEYCRVIAPAFDTISIATDRIKRAQDTKPLSVRVPSTFATRLLIPRLSEFRSQHPGVNVRIITGFGPVDFVREDVDISIQIGSGSWSGTQGQLLFDNWIQPLCSPQFLATRPIRSIDDLIGVQLLCSQNRRSDWQDWLNAMQRSDFPLERSEFIEFPNSMLAYQAAVDGLGVVIGHLPLLGPDLATKALVPALERPIRQESYYAVWRAERGPNRNSRKFLDWLHQRLDPLVVTLG